MPMINNANVKVVRSIEGHLKLRVSISSPMYYNYFFTNYFERSNHM